MQGLGEHDRLPIVVPTQVEMDIDGTSYLRLQKGYKLCKGNKRVSIINPALKSDPYDIILHQNEAYARPALQSEVDPTAFSTKDIIDVNSSIQHRLALVSIPT